MAKMSDTSTTTPLNRPSSPLTSVQDLEDEVHLYKQGTTDNPEVVSLVAATVNKRSRDTPLLSPPLHPPGQMDPSKQEKNCDKCCKKGGLCSCFKTPDNNKWSSTMTENVFQSDEVAETKYPRVYKILDMKIWDFLFVFSCLASIFLYTFCEGFLIENRILWGLIHVTNALYTILLLLQWVQVILKTKYAPNSFTRVDIIFSLLSVLPIDLIVLLIHSINAGGSRPEDYLTFTVSRLHYCFRIKNVVSYLSNWENQLILGDFHSFLLRVLLYTTFIIHSFACVWHRLACRSFRPRHFMMEPGKAREELCLRDSWIIKLSQRAGNATRNGESFPFFQNTKPGTGILWDHYAVSLYWSTEIVFRLGYGDIQFDIKNYGEVMFATLCQIISWIFSLAIVSATLTALLIERETEEQKFLTRKSAIKHYLEFSRVRETVSRELKSFYDYLWLKRKGFSELKLLDFMPATLKSEIYYDIHKPLLEQILTFSDLDPAFLSALSVRMKHSFHLEGEILYRKYERGKRMYLVLKGYLEVLNADESHPITYIRSGSIIGELFLMHPYFHGCTVQCGCECDMLSLSRTSMKEALTEYPQYNDMLQSRIEDRFDQAVVLLSLAAKYNEAPRLFERLKNEMPTPILQEPKGSTPRRRKMTTFIRDADGLTIAASVAEKMSQGKNKNKEWTEKGTQSHQHQAFHAFANDVTRALTLAKEMGGIRCPLFVTPPDDYDLDEDRRDSWTNTKNRRSCCRKLQELSMKKGEEIPLFFLCWKGFVSFFVLAVFLYYPYQFAFRRSNNRTNLIMNMIAHLVDVVFALDFFLDNVQIVVTPEKRLWKVGQILVYRLRTCRFYWRLLAFLPIEYAFIWIVDCTDINSSPWFYLFKLNRFIEVSVLVGFFKDLQSYTRLPILAVFHVKCTLILVYTIHIFAVLVKFLTSDLIPTVYGLNNASSSELRSLDSVGTYEFSFYWATQSVVVVGFGDISLSYSLQLLLLSFAFITGTIILTYAGCRSATIITNASRKRVIFRQTYYSLTAFLRIRNFPEDLSERVKNYFKMHWTAHEGILLSERKTPIWDAPKVLSTGVMLSQGLRYIVRVPIFKYVHEPVLKETCRALKQYVVPPNETILHEGDLRRDLYMIVKGFCVVHRGKELIGHLSEGNYFGLSGLMMGVNQNFRITTETHCFLFCLEFNDFVQIAKKHIMIRKDYKILRGELHLERRPSTKPSKQKGSQSQSQSQIQSPAATPSVPLIPATMNHLAKDLQLYDDDFEETRKRNREKDEKSTEPSSKTDLVQTESQILKPKPNNLGCKCCRFFLFRKSIKPNGRFMIGWMIFRCACAGLTSCCVLAQIAFSFNPTATFFVILFFDIVAWIDLYLMLNVAFYNDLNQLVTDPLKCAVHYLKSSFVLDLLLCFPFDLIAIFATPGIDFIRGNYAGNFRWIALLRLTRFFQVYKLVQLSIYCCRTVSKSLLLITFAEIVPWAGFFIHIIACLSVYKVCSVSVNGGDINCSSNAWITHGYLFLDDSINKVYEFQKQPFKMYLTALYWTISSIMRVGYGDIELRTMENRVIATSIMIFGTIMIMFIGSKLTAALFGEDPRRIELRTKVGVMQSFLGRFKVSRSIQRRVDDVYSNDWDTTTGIPVDSLFGALLPSLRTDVMCHLYEDSIRQSPLLKNLDDVGVRLLASLVREDFLVEGEYLFQYGNMTDEVFLVTSGIVGAYNFKGDIMSYMAPGSLIGEMSALYGVTRLYNAKAATDTDVLVFTTEDFLNFLEMYPDLKDTVEQLCIRYYQDMMNRSLNVASFEFSTKSEERKDDDKKSLAPITSVFSNASEVRSILTDGSKISESKDPKISRNLCVLDPLRVPMRKGQIKDKEKELLLQEISQTKTWWNIFITYGRTPKSEMGAFLHIFEDKKHCSCWKYTIHPASPLLQSAWWSVFCLLITALSCSFSSYELAFYSKNDQNTMFIISGLRNFIEIFFIARIILTFHLGFYDIEGSLVTDSKAIAKRYCCRFDGFIMDLLTTFPFYLILYIFRNITTHDNVEHIHDTTIRGIQLLRVFLFIRYLNTAEYNLRMKASQVKIIKILVILFFTFHFCACAWYIIACYGSTCEQQSWMDVVLYKLISTKQIENKTDVTMGTRYFMSLEFVATTIADCGFSDITARLPIELFITIVYIFCALFAVGVLSGRMTQIFTSQIYRKIHYEQELSVIDSHFWSLGLQKSKRDLVTEYYKLVWRRFRGMSYYSLLCELPFPLRSDIAFEVYGPNVKNSRVFGKIDELIMRQMTARIRHEFYLPGTHIVRGGNVCEAVYFIKRGEVLIIDENMGIELCVETLYENDCFGEIKVLLNHEPFRFSYVARLESEIGVLCHDDLDEILQNFPALRTDLISKAGRIKSHRIDVKAQSELRQTFDVDSIAEGPAEEEKRGSRDVRIPKANTQVAFINKPPKEPPFNHVVSVGKPVKRNSSVPKIDLIDPKKRASTDQKDKDKDKDKDKERKISVQKKSSGLIPAAEKKRQGSTANTNTNTNPKPSIPRQSIPKPKESKSGSILISTTPTIPSRKGSTKKTKEDKKKN